MGEDQDKSSIKSKKSSSSSSSEHGTENDEADTGNGLRVEFQRRKSSYSSIESSTLNLQECIDIEEPVFSINSANQPTLPEGMYSIILDLIWISWRIPKDFCGHLLFPTWLKQNFFITEIHTNHTSDSDSDSSTSSSSYDISEGTVYISGQYSCNNIKLRPKFKFPAKIEMAFSSNISHQMMI